MLQTTFKAVIKCLEEINSRTDLESGLELISPDLSYITSQDMWVIDSRMLCSLPRSCLVHPVDRFDSEEWFSFDYVIF